MPFIDRNLVTRIDLPTPGEWVEVQSALTAGQKARLDAAGKATILVNKDSGELQVNEEATERSTFLALEMTIRGWSFGVPVTPERIRDLAPEDIDILAARCNQLWAPRSEVETKN